MSNETEAFFNRSLIWCGKYDYFHPVKGVLYGDLLSENAKNIIELNFWKPPGQNFEKFATPFEKKFSSLIKPHSMVRPVVDKDLAKPTDLCSWGLFPVIAYIGWLNGQMIQVPRGQDRGSVALSTVLMNEKVRTVIDYPGSGQGIRQPYAASEEKFLIVINVHGEVLWHLGYDIVGLNSSSQAKTAGIAAVRKITRTTTFDLIKYLAVALF